ncbi:MAG: hypothetical protein M3389_14995 [Actinomycetota bacterium]|nr:hypothetical protein [Actinomycetota bacterium]
MRLKRTISAAAVTSVAALGALTGSAQAASEKTCVTLYDFPDAGSTVCVFSQGPCLVGEYRTTFIGTEFYCYVPRP